MDKFFTYNGSRLHYTDCGEGHPILLLHGWGCNATTFNAIRPFLEARFRVLTVDFAGFGQSDEPSEVWGVEEYTRSIEALAQAEGVENPILIGHSFGGRVSIVYASRNKVQKVMLVDAAGVKPKRSLNYYRKVYTFKLMKATLPILIGKQKASMLIEQRRSKGGSSDYNRATPMMRAILSKCVNEDLCHLMPRVTAPVLLFWGDKDTATPISDAHTMQRLMPDAGLVVAQGAGHFAMLEQAELWRASLMSFLKIE